MSPLRRISQHVLAAPRELRLFIAASLAMGVGYSLFDATFNNYINDRFVLSGFARSFLEMPRELPGLLCVFISALLWFLCSRRLGALAMALGALGAALIGFASPNYAVMVIWLFLYSLGQHLFLPVASTIGMELAEKGRAGARLGQLNAIRNAATIAGSFLVFVGFKYLGFDFHHTFALATLAFVVAAALLFAMRPHQVHKPKLYLKMHRPYRLFYILAILFGSRKQLFITFAPWVIVSVFKEPTATMGTLLTLGGVIGILFQPLLGRAVDRFGERSVLAAEAVSLVFVCLGYGFARFVFAERVAFYVTCACFLADQMLMSVSMARSTYMKKIALDPAHVQPALTLSVTIDHVFSISVALLGGVIWNAYGYQYVFLMGMAIAAINFFAAMQVKVPRRHEDAAPQPVGISEED